MAVVQQTPPPFKVGETVVIRSSVKLLMTVIEVKDENIRCMFYSNVLGKFEKEYFPVSCLRKPPTV
jgi:hypothetical protein